MDAAMTPNFLTWLLVATSATVGWLIGFFYGYKRGYRRCERDDENALLDSATERAEAQGHI